MVRRLVPAGSNLQQEEQESRGSAALRRGVAQRSRGILFLKPQSYSVLSCHGVAPKHTRNKESGPRTRSQFL